MNRYVAALVLLAACAPPRHRRYVATPTATSSPRTVPDASPSPAPTATPPPAVASSTCLPLDASLSPLLAVLQTARPDMPQDFAQTVAPYVYVSDLGAWEAVYPAGSVQRAAILAHERVHALRQGSDPIPWCSRYQSDAAFRLDEEKLGYAEQIRVLVAGGAAVDVDGFVAALTSPFYGGMISSDDARTWVQATIDAH